VQRKARQAAQRKAAQAAQRKATKQERSKRSQGWKASRSSTGYLARGVAQRPLKTFCITGALFGCLTAQHARRERETKAGRASGGNQILN